MRCDQVADRLPAAAEGLAALDPAARRHVERCLRCQADAVQYRRVLRAMRALRTEVLVPDARPAPRDPRRHRRGGGAAGPAQHGPGPSGRLPRGAGGGDGGRRGRGGGPDPALPPQQGAPGRLIGGALRGYCGGDRRGGGLGRARRRRRCGTASPRCRPTPTTRRSSSSGPRAASSSTSTAAATSTPSRRCGSPRSATASPSSTRPLRDQLDRVAHSTMLGNGNRVVIELAEALGRGRARRRRPLPLRLRRRGGGRAGAEDRVPVLDQPGRHRPHHATSRSAAPTTATRSARSRSATAASAPTCSTRCASRSCGRPRSPTRTASTARSRWSPSTPHELAAVVVEPLVQGAAGMQLADPDGRRRASPPRAASTTCC